MSEHYYFRQGLDLDGDRIMRHRRRGPIETREVSAYLHARWDTDGDGFVGEDEWPLP